jgi:hypothetical protein
MASSYWPFDQHWCANVNPSRYVAVLLYFIQFQWLTSLLIWLFYGYTIQILLNIYKPNVHVSTLVLAWSDHLVIHESLSPDFSCKLYSTAIKPKRSINSLKFMICHFTNLSVHWNIWWQNVDAPDTLAIVAGIDPVGLSHHINSLNIWTCFIPMEIIALLILGY